MSKDRKQYMKEYYKAHREHWNDYIKEYRKKYAGHNGSKRVKTPEWYKRKVSNWKAQKIILLPQFKTYWEQYSYFYLKANKQCEICGRPLRMWYSKNISPEKYKSMQSAQLDHNHLNGEPRGILCVGCNTLVGKIENQLDGYMINVSKYIEKNIKK